MTWIKICGITDLQDALAAVEAGADAVGFVFYQKSPRNVAPETVRQIVRELPARVQKVGVLVGSPDHSLDPHALGLTGLQRHLGVQAGVGSNGGLRAVSGPGRRPLHNYLSLPAAWFLEREDSARNFISSLSKLRDTLQAQAPNQPDPVTAIFLDSGNLQQPGGTGTTFDWQRASTMVDDMKKAVNVVVAGGLNPANVGEAVRILHPWGVDVSSGVETRPGKKDPEKVRAFIQAVREAEKN